MLGKLDSFRKKLFSLALYPSLWKARKHPSKQNEMKNRARKTTLMEIPLLFYDGSASPFLLAEFFSTPSLAVVQQLGIQGESVKMSQNYSH